MLGIYLLKNGGLIPWRGAHQQQKGIGPRSLHDRVRIGDKYANKSPPNGRHVFT